MQQAGSWPWSRLIADSNQGGDPVKVQVMALMHGAEGAIERPLVAELPRALAEELIARGAAEAIDGRAAVEASYVEAATVAPAGEVIDEG